MRLGMVPYVLTLLAGTSLQHPFFFLSATAAGAAVWWLVAENPKADVHGTYVPDSTFVFSMSCSRGFFRAV
ncbi:MAG: hypothetical protein AB1758_07655 [Candidatus Eremiobacterota bacterium]